MDVLRKPLGDLTPDPSNLRDHPEQSVERIAASLKRFGQQKPIVVTDSGVIVAGNGTYLAAKSLGWDALDCVVTGLESTDATLYAIADNRTYEFGVWRDVDLSRVLLGIETEDQESVGFSLEDVNRLVASVAAMQDGEDGGSKEQIPDPPENPVSRPGDVWVCDRHRVVCGDSTEADVLNRALNGASPRLCVTDPPYGVSYDPKWRQKGGRNKGVKNDNQADWSAVWSMLPCEVIYCWHASLFANVVLDSLKRSGFEHRAQIIWNKPAIVMSRGHYHWKHEPCWYAVKKGAESRWIGDRKQSTVWDIPLDKNEGNHGTQKPIPCMAIPIGNHAGDVIDPFLGSGTTLAAAHLLGRTCYGVEIDPAYTDVAVRRWQALASQDATLEGDGRTFDQIAAERIQKDETDG